MVIELEIDFKVQVFVWASGLGELFSSPRFKKFFFFKSLFSIFLFQQLKLLSVQENVLYSTSQAS